MKSKWLNEKENLERLIKEEKRSYEEIGRLYGCSGSNIKKVAKQIGIELEPRRVVREDENFSIRKKDAEKFRKCLNCGKTFYMYSGSTGKYCCNKCQKEYEHKKKYELILKGDPSIMKANYIPRIFKNDIIEEQGGVCAICGMKPIWNGKPLVFIMDHIDGHASNNKRDNLRCICPNCDSQLDTYKSKNKCGERSYYRYHKEDKNNKIGK